MLIRQMKLNKIPSLTLPLVPTVQTDKPLYSVGTLFMEEIWKDIIGYEGFYKVSNLGNVKNLERSIKNGVNSSFILKERILKQVKNKIGYIGVGLHKKGVRKQAMIHRLVGIHFIPNTENKPQINHKDGNKTNNSIENLEWCTHSENAYHAFKTGLRVVSKKIINNLNKISSKSVVNTLTKDEYTSIKIAAEKENIKLYKLRLMLAGKMKNKTNLKYK